MIEVRPPNSWAALVVRGPPLLGGRSGGQTWTSTNLYPAPMPYGHQACDDAEVD
ncbi:hypothetical protein FB554_3119 [Barrientosiimonas humi]|uniref:Uncharacterized protein n=1 Tax=Barrientosiimonas humi TaxID=999931 RepID=A0A542XGI0_9MICO|nr:hypothetical protein FB554_3119 [Barrientosiimonas humi]